MTDRKREAPLFLDIDFGEALERFGTTDPKEVKELMERAKQKKQPPGNKSPTTKTRQKATPLSKTTRDDGD